MSLAAIEIRLMVRGSLIGPMRSITLARRDSCAAGFLDPDDVAGLGVVPVGRADVELAAQLAVGRRDRASRGRLGSS